MVALGVSVAGSVGVVDVVVVALGVVVIILDVFVVFLNVVADANFVTLYSKWNFHLSQNILPAYRLTGKQSC